MTFAEAFVVLVGALAVLSGLPCWWMILSVLAPKIHTDAADICTEKPLAATLTGLPFILICGYLIFYAVESLFWLRALIACFILFGFMFAQIGLAGLACRLSVLSNADDQRTRLRHGCYVLVLSFIFPVIGWFFVFGLALSIGFGSALLAMFRRRAA